MVITFTSRQLSLMIKANQNMLDILSNEVNKINYQKLKEPIYQYREIIKQLALLNLSECTEATIIIKEP